MYWYHWEKYCQWEAGKRAQSVNCFLSASVKTWFWSSTQSSKVAWSGGTGLQAQQDAERAAESQACSPESLNTRQVPVSSELTCLKKKRRRTKKLTDRCYMHTHSGIVRLRHAHEWVYIHIQEILSMWSVHFKCLITYNWLLCATINKSIWVHRFMYLRLCKFLLNLNNFRQGLI